MEVSFHQRSWGLLHCQLAQVFDLLGSGQVEGAKDVLAMAMVMIDPAVLDAGRLQEDPATQLFTPAQGSSGSVRPCSRGPAKSAPDRSKKQQRAKPKEGCCKPDRWVRKRVSSPLSKRGTEAPVFLVALPCAKAWV